MGEGIGVGIANALKRGKLVMFSAAVAGFVGAFADKIIALNATLTLGMCGNPIGAYVVALFAIEIVSLYAGKTKLDILIVPLGTLVLCFAGCYLAFPFIWLIQIVYKGDHYQVIIRTDEEEEDFVVDTEYTWNENDRVSVKIPKDKIKLKLKAVTK